jgi:hypothetical protein
MRESLQSEEKHGKPVKTSNPMLPASLSPLLGSIHFFHTTGGLGSGMNNTMNPLPNSSQKKKEPNWVQPITMVPHNTK